MPKVQKGLLATLFLLTLAAFFILGTQLPLTSTNNVESPLFSLEHSEKRKIAPLPDFSQIHDTQEKKQSFFGYLVPIIQTVNSQVMVERANIIKLKEKQSLTTKEKQYLERIAKAYRVKINESNYDELFTSLLTKVDKLPPSLVVAQAANESAWGTSRFAKKGNNLFGQWCFSKGCGIVPQRRDSNAVHEVAQFQTVHDSVESYVLNINRHAQYRTLRSIRLKERHQKNAMSGLALADGLIGYSERGQDYVNEIKSMIRFNNLSSLDQKS